MVACVRVPGIPEAKESMSFSVQVSPEKENITTNKRKSKNSHYCHEIHFLGTSESRVFKISIDY